VVEWLRRWHFTQVIWVTFPVRLTGVIGESGKAYSHYSCSYSLVSLSLNTSESWNNGLYENSFVQDSHASWKVLKSPGFFFKIPGPGKSWKITLVLESPGN